MKVLVAGGSGFLGAAVADACVDQGWETWSMSRRGDALVGRPIAGDVLHRDLNLDEETLDEMRAGLTHVVSCFGSVDWAGGPSLARELHRGGTRNLLDFAATCHSLERVVHVSSVLALGRAEGQIDNDVIDVGQRFRTWYEYGKFLAEIEVRERADLPTRIVRLGPILGPGNLVAPDASHGLLASLPTLLRGYPVNVEGRGDWPCYPCDAETAAAVLLRAATDTNATAVWTWWDRADPTLAHVLTGLCSAGGTVPRLVESGALDKLTALLGRRFGVPDELRGYTRRWIDLDPALLDELPADLPACPAGYVEATGLAVRTAGLAP